MKPVKDIKIEDLADNEIEKCFEITFDDFVNADFEEVVKEIDKNERNEVK